MPTINVSVPHKLGTDEAKRRITHLIGDARSKFGGQATDVRETWTADRNDFAFKAMGFSVSGVLQVAPDAVAVQMNIPFAALPFKGRIEQEITAKAKELLA